MKTKEEIINWMSNEKRILDHQTVLFLDDMHKKLTEIESKAKKRLKELESNGLPFTKEDYNKIMEQDKK